MSTTLTPVKTEDQWRDYHSIRRAVLWEARGRANYDDRYPDEYLPDNYPLLLHVDGKAVGTLRLDDKKNGTAVVRLVAMAENEQHRGYGRQMSDLFANFARGLGANTLLVNSAPEAVEFYVATGWTRFSWGESELTGIAKDCVQMRKLLGSVELANRVSHATKPPRIG